jgi:excisionase family DNA binding protein
MYNGVEGISMKQASKKTKRSRANGAPADVMDLAGAARYLRLPPKTVVRLVKEQALPGRQIGKQWRFLRAAIERWLEPSRGAKGSVMNQAGALKDDPTYAEYRRIIEDNRRRWNEEVA